MDEITVPGAELPWAASILQEGCAAMLAFHRRELLPLHPFGMCSPPCHAALGGTEPFLPMPGRLFQWGIALWASIRACDLHRLGRFLFDGITLAIGLDCIDR